MYRLLLPQVKKKKKSKNALSLKRQRNPLSGTPKRVFLRRLNRRPIVKLLRPSLQRIGNDHARNTTPHVGHDIVTPAKGEAGFNYRPHNRVDVTGKVIPPIIPPRGRVTPGASTPSDDRIAPKRLVREIESAIALRPEFSYVQSGGARNASGIFFRNGMLKLPDLRSTPRRNRDFLIEGLRKTGTPIRN